MAPVTQLAVVAAICQPDRLPSLENKLQELPKFDDLTLFSRNKSNRTSNNDDIICFNCEQKRQIITQLQVNFNIWCALSFCDKSGILPKSVAYSNNRDTPDARRMYVAITWGDGNKDIKRTPPSTILTKLSVNSITCVNS